MNKSHSVHQRLSVCAQKKAEEISLGEDIIRIGLTDAQAEESRRFYGTNKIVGQNKDTVFLRLRRAFINPMSIILLILASISFLTDVVFVSNFSRNITTVLLILSILLISGVIRFVQEMRSRNISAKLVNMIHTSVQVCRNGIWQECPAGELAVGDLVRLDAGDRVPADIRLIQASDFFVTQSMVTGESGIIEKTSDALTKVPKWLGDYTNTVFMGSTVTGGIAKGIVMAVGEDTVYGGAYTRNTARKNGFTRGEYSIAWVLIKFMLVLIPIVFLAYALTKGDWLNAFLFALSVSVELTPELLPMVITACLAKGSASMGQKQTIVKNIDAMQSFGSMDVLCVDKTGTLTGDKILLEYYMDVLGKEDFSVLDYAYLNSFYHTGVSNHLDSAICRAEHMPGQEKHFSDLVAANSKIDEIPFDYSRKYSSVLIKSGNSLPYSGGKPFLIVKGSVWEVVRQCSYIMYKGERRMIGSEETASVRAVVDDMFEDGMKVLAIAFKTLDKDTATLDDETDLTLAGYLAFFDAPKKSSASAISKLHDLNIKIKILTGDHMDVAVSICRRVGIAAENVMTGTELEHLSEDELKTQIEATTVFAELSPMQKSHIVNVLQNNGHSVGFLGDGMNDLAAELQADVGISVDNATDAVKESADVILLKKDLNVLGDGVLEGRRAFINMSKYIKITASSNFGTVCAIVAASVLLPFYPITAVQLILLDLVYDILCLALPWDNVDDELSDDPLEWSGKHLGRFMLFFGLISLIFDILIFGFMYFYMCPSLCGGIYQSLDEAGKTYFISLFQTGWFLESLWSQVLILHLLRTNQLPFVQSSPSRPMIAVTVVGLLISSILTITPLGSVLELTALPAVYYAALVLDVVLYLLLAMFMKKLYIVRYGNLY